MSQPTTPQNQPQSQPVKGGEIFKKTPEERKAVKAAISFWKRSQRTNNAK